MKYILLLIFIPILSFNAKTQFNDTIFYKSGMEKVAEIKEFTTTFLKFKTVNSKGYTVNSQIGTNVVKRFVMYDDEDILQYDSRLDGAEHTNGSVRKNSKYPSTVSVSTHQLSINPFFIPFLSLNAKYNYRFGSKMQYSICSRATLISPLLEDFTFWGNSMIGVGFQLAPFYNERFAFGIDFIPQVGFFLDGSDGATVMLPISVDFDFYFNERIGVSADFGCGRMLGSNAAIIGVRGHVGVLIQFKNKTTFETGYKD